MSWAIPTPWAARPAKRRGGRALPLVLGLCVVIAAVAVGGAQEPRPITLRLVLWNYGFGAVEDALYEDVRESFMRTHKQVDLRLSRDSWANAYSSTRVWLGTTDDPADVILIRDAWFDEYLPALLGLDEEFTDRDLAGFWPAALDCCQREGRPFGIPWIVRTKALYCRDDLLRKAGERPPTTWDEVGTVAAAIADPPKVYGFGLPGALDDDYTAETFLLPIWADGGRLDRPAGQWALGQEVLKGLELYDDLINRQHATQPEVLTWRQRELEGFFACGRLGMVVSEPWLTQFLDEHFDSLDYQVQPLPAGAHAITQLSVDMLCVSKGTRYPELACELIRELCTERVLSVFPPVAGLPADRKAGESAARRHKAKLGPFVAGLSSARSVPRRFWPEARPWLDELIYEVVSGRKLPEDALRDSAARGAPVDLPEPERRPVAPPEGAGAPAGAGTPPD